MNCSREAERKVYTINDRLQIDCSAHCLYDLNSDNKRIELTAQRYEILLYLCENAGNVLTYDVIIDRIDPDGYGSHAALQAQVSRLKKDLSDHFGKDFVDSFLINIRSTGYRIDGICECQDVNEMRGTGTIHQIEADDPAESYQADDIPPTNEDIPIMKSFKKDYKKFLKYFIYHDPCAEPIYVDYLDIIDRLHDKWMFDYRELADSGNRTLVLEIIKTFDEYMYYLSSEFMRTMPDETRIIIGNEPSQVDKQEQEDMRGNVKRIREKLAELFKLLYPVPEENVSQNADISFENTNNMSSTVNNYVNVGINNGTIII